MDDYKMEERDRLGELPDSLILHILSFLPMRDVVSTTFLSKRWENLWTILPILNFSDIIRDRSHNDQHRVRNFVNRALLFWKGTKLKKFTIDIEHGFDKSLAGDMDLWLRFVVENKVEELNLRLPYKGVENLEVDNEDLYRAPQCLNSCSSLRKLSLFGCNLLVHGSVSWNQLKNLSMEGFCFSEGMINRILSGTPQLEVFRLCLVESNANLNIRSKCLKKLKIIKHLFYRGEQPSLDSVLRICCPNLETLKISGVFYGKCLFTNVSSLTDATLDLYDLTYHEFNDSMYYDAPGIKVLGETMRHVFSTFQHVERVTLSSGFFQVIGASLKKNLFSPLPNVVFLKVEVDDLIELVEMVHHLEIFPNLKMLVIEDQSYPPGINAENYSEFKTNLTKSCMLQLKIIEITSNFYNSSMFRYVEFLLKHCSMLEKLVVQTISRLQARSLEIAERLLRMPRSSPTAEVIIFNKK
ncbi:hypothetical protein ACS0TY_008702 [Phlomoides rotata]